MLKRTPRQSIGWWPIWYALPFVRDCDDFAMQTIWSENTLGKLNGRSGVVQDGVDPSLGWAFVSCCYIRTYGLPGRPNPACEGYKQTPCQTDTKCRKVVSKSLDIKIRKKLQKPIDK